MIDNDSNFSIFVYPFAVRQY